VQDLLARRHLRPPDGGIEGREELVAYEDVRARDRVEQAGLAGVRVPHEGGGRQLGALAGLALGLAHGRHRLQLALELGDPVEHPSPVHLELRLAGSPGPDAGAEAAELHALAAEAGEAVAKHRQLHLGHAGPARGVQGEDVEDQSDPVHDVYLEDLLQVSLLHRAQLAIDHEEVDVERLPETGQLLRLALAEIGGDIGVGAPLHRGVDDVRAGRVDEEFHLRQRLVHGCLGHAVVDHGDEERLLALDVEVGDRCGESGAIAPDVT
jgi:hypothetical protein